MDDTMPGREVRFRRRDRGRWHTGIITGPADGGAACWVRDIDTGASRCLRLDQVEIAERGTKGGLVWASVAARRAQPSGWVQGLIP